MGTYIGSGSASQSVTLGFKPSCVFVMATKMPAMFVNFSAGNAQALFGCAADIPTNDGGSMGLEITSTGFRLRSGPSYNVGPNTAALNLAGTIYAYIAMK